MSNVLLAAALLSGLLAVSGCGGLYPGGGTSGNGGGGSYPSYGGTQTYPYDAGAGGSYAQQSQPYYQPQAEVYSGNSGAYAYQSTQVPQAPGGYPPPPPGRWIDQRQQRQDDRIQQGLASGQLTPDEARRLREQQGRIAGAEGRMRADGYLSPQERGRLNAMQQRGSQNIYGMRHNGVQTGPTAQPQSTGGVRPMMQSQPRGGMRPMVQPQSTGPARPMGRCVRRDHREPPCSPAPQCSRDPLYNGGPQTRRGRPPKITAGGTNPAAVRYLVKQDRSSQSSQLGPKGWCEVFGHGASGLNQGSR